MRTHTQDSGPHRWGIRESTQGPEGLLGTDELTHTHP